MTQAFNLSQLANNVDSSGKLSLTTGVAGVLPVANGGTNGLLPVANGGTGTATPSLVAGSNITVSGSWPNQTIAAGGGGGVTSLNGQTGAITNTALLAIGCYTLAFYGQGTETIGTTWAGSSLRYTNMAGTGGGAFIGSGTWRLMALVNGSTAPACSSLYVRIA